MGYIMLGGGMKDTSRTRKFFVHPGVGRGGGATLQKRYFGRDVPQGLQYP